MYLLYITTCSTAGSARIISWNERRKKKSKAKRQEKKEIFLFKPLSCGRLGIRQTSALQGLRITVKFSQSHGFMFRAMLHASPIPNPCRTLLSWKILLACLTSKPLFFNHSFTVSIHLFLGLPTERLPAHSLHRPYYQSCHSPFSLHCSTIGGHLH